MFVIANSKRIHSPFMLRDEFLCSMVELELCIPILMVSAHEREGESRLEVNRTYFLQTHDFQQFAGTAECRIVRVDVISPAHVNGSDRWKLEPVEEIWRCPEPEHQGYTAWLFRVAGQVYCDSCFNTEPSSLKPELCVYTQR